MSGPSLVTLSYQSEPPPLDPAAADPTPPPAPADPALAERERFMDDTLRRAAEQAHDPRTGHSGFKLPPALVTTPQVKSHPATQYALFRLNPEVMARPVIESVMRFYGGKPVTVDHRTHLDNEVAAALGWPPSLGPDGQPRPLSRARIRDADLYQGVLDEDQTEQIEKVSGKIVQLGGKHASFTVLPVVCDLPGEASRMAATPVFKVEGRDGRTHYVDHRGLDYDSLDDYRHHNDLPRGDHRLVMPQDGEWQLDARGRPKLFVGQARLESTLERARREYHVDTAVAGAGLVAGTLAAVGGSSAGGVGGAPGALLAKGSLGLLAAQGVGLLASVHGIGVTADRLRDRLQHGDDMNPFSNPAAGLEEASILFGGASLATQSLRGATTALGTLVRQEGAASDQALKVGNAALARSSRAAQVDWGVKLVQVEEATRPFATKPVRYAMNAGNAGFFAHGATEFTSRYAERPADENAAAAVQLIPGFISTAHTAARMTRAVFGPPPGAGVPTPAGTPTGTGTTNSNTHTNTNTTTSTSTSTTTSPASSSSGTATSATTPPAGAHPSAGQTAKVLGGSAAATLAFGAAGAVGQKLQVLGDPVANDLRAFATRATVGLVRTYKGTRLAEHVKQLDAGHQPKKHLDALESTLVKRAGAWGIPHADREAYRQAIATVRAELRGGRTSGFDADAIATLKKANAAAIWASDTRAGKIADGTVAATFAYSNGVSLAWLAKGGFKADDIGSYVSTLALVGNFSNAMRGPVPYLSRALGLPGFPGSKAFRDYGLFASGAYTAGAAAYMGHGLSKAQGLLDVGKALSVGVFGLGTGAPVWRDVVKPTLWPGSPTATFKVDPGFLTSGGILGLAAFGLTQVEVKQREAQAAAEAASRPTPQARADAGTTPAASHADATRDAGTTSDAGTPRVPQGMARVPPGTPRVPPTGPIPDAGTTPPSDLDTPDAARPVASREPEPAASPDRTAADAHAEPEKPTVVVVDPNDRHTTTLWAIARHNVDTLLSSAEIDSLPRHKEAMLGIERLVDYNPQYHFDLKLLNGQPGDGPGDPDTLNPKRHREFRLTPER